MGKLIIFLMLYTSILSASFDYCIDKTLQFEGETAVRNKDEYSKFGITQELLVTYNNKMFTYYDIETLTKSQAKHIAYEMIWKENNVYNIHNDYKASIVFDFIYNTNSINAIKIIQTVLNDWVLSERKIGNKNLTYLIVDGKIGNKTIELINKIPIEIFASEIKIARICYLKSLSRWKEYGNGWRKRVNNL